MSTNFLMIGIDSMGDRLIHNVDVSDAIPTRKIFAHACAQTRNAFNARRFMAVKLVCIEGTHVHEYNSNEVAELLA